MSLADRLKQGPPKATGPRCAAGKAIATLSAEDQAAVATILANDSGWSNPQIVAELAAEGIDLKSDRLAFHRRGDCACDTR